MKWMSKYKMIALEIALLTTILVLSAYLLPIYLSIPISFLTGVVHGIKPPKHQ